jgi:hypothetical protein
LLLLMCCITFIDLHIIEPPLHPWDEVNLVMVNVLSDLLLDLVCHYFIEDFFYQCSLRRLAYSSPFWILLIWVFSFLILVRFARCLSFLFILSKNQLFVSLILLWFFTLYFINFSPYFYYFSPSTCLEFCLFLFF